jgi:2-polyprenyl-3-methyl-5-hydroxy-6-metoxy-1,4-benzoquinol methylase
MRCRICDSNLELLLEYNNMPKAAQNFPTFEDLDSEKGADLFVSQCISCGLVQLENEPVSYYKEVIRAAAFSEEMRGFRTKQFKQFVKKYSLQDKKVVEIGCGKGEFLSLMKKAGADAHGIEYSDESVQYCLENDLEVEKLYIEKESDRIERGPFDCFFIMNFFEHLPDPNTVLRSLYQNLSDDGLGLIEVPNFDMILKNNLFSEFINDHLFYFTKDTLKLTLELNGFEIIECSEIWYDYIISVVVKKRPKADLTNFFSHQLKIKYELQEYVSKRKNIAIYGAGHQSLAVISLAEIGDKIKYVVDDATFKQGKFTPATHIPIVSNENLKKEPVDAIIIMAASYSDEIAKKIKNNFNINVDVAVLRDFGLEKL